MQIIENDQMLNNRSPAKYMPAYNSHVGLVVQTYTLLWKMLKIIYFELFSLAIISFRKNC